MPRKLKPEEARSRLGGILHVLWERPSARHLSTDKELAHLIGLHAAIIYCELVSLSYNWEKQNKTRPDGYFFCTVETLEAATTLSVYVQNKAIKKLKELGLVSVQYTGDPRKRYIHVNDHISNLAVLLPENSSWQRETPFMKAKNHRLPQ